MAIDWKKQAIRWRRAFWALADDKTDEFKPERKKPAKRKKSAAKKKRAKKTQKKAKQQLSLF